MTSDTIDLICAIPQELADLRSSLERQGHRDGSQDVGGGLGRPPQIVFGQILTGDLSAFASPYAGVTSISVALIDTQTGEPGASESELTAPGVRSADSSSGPPK